MTHTSRSSRASGRPWICRVLLAATALALATGGLAQDAAPSVPVDHAPPAATAPVAAGEHASAPAPDQQETAAHGSQPADTHGAAPGGAGEAAAEHGEEHGESLWAFLSRIANFVILAGGLVYLLRSPLGRDPRRARRADPVGPGQRRGHAPQRDRGVGAH